jgi:group I intron endonuclease
MENKYGVYQIVCKTTGNRYVGSTTKSFKHRWSGHKSLLRAGTHHSIHFQNAWNKYGEDDFLFLILDIVDDKKECSVLEQSYFDSIDHKILYNIQFNATAYPHAGSAVYSGYRKAPGKMSDETKKRISESKKNVPGKKHSEETKKKMSEIARARPFNTDAKERLAKARTMIQPHSDEVRKRLSDLSRSRGPVSEESKKKMSEAQRNRHPASDETKRKISESKKGQRCSDEVYKKIADKNRGSQRTDETKRKMSESQKGRTRSEETLKKMSEVQSGKKQSPETIMKRLETQKRNRELKKLNAG